MTIEEKGYTYTFGLIICRVSGSLYRETHRGILFVFGDNFVLMSIEKRCNVQWRYNLFFMVVSRKKVFIKKKVSSWMKRDEVFF